MLTVEEKMARQIFKTGSMYKMETELSISSREETVENNSVLYSEEKGGFIINCVID